MHVAASAHLRGSVRQQQATSRAFLRLKELRSTTIDWFVLRFAINAGLFTSKHRLITDLNRLCVNAKHSFSVLLHSRPCSNSCDIVQLKQPNQNKTTFYSSAPISRRSRSRSRRRPEFLPLLQSDRSRRGEHFPNKLKRPGSFLSRLSASRST